MPDREQLSDRCATGYCAGQPACPEGTCKREVSVVDVIRRRAETIARTLEPLYEVDFMEPGGEPREADMAALVESILRAAEPSGAVGRIRELEQALDRAAGDLRSEGHYELSERAYAPLEDE
jgi:hypothetical protein